MTTHWIVRFAAVAGAASVGCMLGARGDARYLEADMLVIGERQSGRPYIVLSAQDEGAMLIFCDGSDANRMTAGVSSDGAAVFIQLADANDMSKLRVAQSDGDGCFISLGDATGQDVCQIAAVSDKTGMFLSNKDGTSVIQIGIGESGEGVVGVCDSDGEPRFIANGKSVITN